MPPVASWHLWSPCYQPINRTWAKYTYMLHYTHIHINTIFVAGRQFLFWWLGPWIRTAWAVRARLVHRFHSDTTRASHPHCLHQVGVSLAGPGSRRASSRSSPIHVRRISSRPHDTQGAQLIRRTSSWPRDTQGAHLISGLIGSAPLSGLRDTKCAPRPHIFQQGSSLCQLITMPHFPVKWVNYRCPLSYTSASGTHP